MFKGIKHIGSQQNEILSCTKDLVSVHYDTVYPLVKNTEKEAYTSLMVESINQGNAYCYKDNSCFMYYRKINKYEGFGVCFYGKKSPYKMLKLLSYIFNVKDKDTNILRFKPHRSSEIKNYKSLLVKASVKKFYRTGNCVTIRVDILRKKLINIVDKVLSSE
jgi:hypothetical protein